MTRALPERIQADGYGILIDRSKPISFTFDGVRHTGFDGDVIASALAANGRRVLSRSFKYHRPRGVLTMAGHDANTLVQVGDEPNVRADRHAVRDGLEVRSINRGWSLDHDPLAVLGALSRLLPVGFYYKTFFRPSWAWKFWERPIRSLAGLGKLDPGAAHRYYDKSYRFADVLVIGGGLSGLNAAMAAADAGAETLLLEEWPELGGALLYGRGAGSRAATEAARRSLVEKARRTPNLEIMTATTASGLFSDNWASAICGERLLKIRSKHTILACGAFDQPLVFANNDRPGIMFASAAQRLMSLYGVRPGSRAVIATANRFGYEAAFDLLDAGIGVAAIVDLNTDPHGPLTDAAKARGVRVISGATIVDARSSDRKLKSVAVAAIASSGAAGQKREWIYADLALMSVGFSPAVNLACHVGAPVKYDPAIKMHRIEDCPQGLSVVGSMAGIWSRELVSLHAAETGRRAATCALGAKAPQPPRVHDEEASRVTHGFPIFTTKRGMDFVDFDEDLQVKDIVNSVKDGYSDIQLVKRYSTEGFGPSQGRHANLNTIRIVGDETGALLHEIGTTTFRPPLVPEKFAHMAGRAREPVRRSAIHARHIELGAQFMPAGLWLRPAYYGSKADSRSAVEAEIRAVRNGVGLIDVSTLGGLDIRGVDAAAFVDRMYTWAYGNQPVGRARYALMTDMSGVIIDDGVACRLADRHYYVTATTGAIDQVYRAMSWFNVQWKLDVDVANVTSAYAAVNLAGPDARRVIEALEGDIDFSKGAFPYMSVRTGTLAGIPVRILRVGFVGELGFEIHCPSGLGEALWDQLMDAGRPFGIVPFGVEAQRVLRLEKGHIIVGQDTDGLTNPLEAGMEWALAKKKPFYVGKRSIEMLRAKGVTRTLAGFELMEDGGVIPKENHLVIRGETIAGRVTSIARSAALGKVIGLAYLPMELAEVSSTFEIRGDGGRMFKARVVATPFYDPQNSRQET